MLGTYFADEPEKDGHLGFRIGSLGERLRQALGGHSWSVSKDVLVGFLFARSESTASRLDFSVGWASACAATPRMILDIFCIWREG